MTVKCVIITILKKVWYEAAASMLRERNLYLYLYMCFHLYFFCICVDASKVQEGVGIKCDTKQQQPPCWESVACIFVCICICVCICSFVDASKVKEGVGEAAASMLRERNASNSSWNLEWDACLEKKHACRCSTTQIQIQYNTNTNTVRCLSWEGAWQHLEGHACTCSTI